jgi:SAM-dependent methyltransferase
MTHEDDAAEFWTDRYGQSDRIWSGNANRALVDVIAALRADGVEPGTALDLGSGEGGDALWLAGEGWTVTGVEIAGNAIARAAAAADRAGLADRLTWVEHDLADWTTHERFDLVSASFLHSPVSFPRREVLRRAAGLVATGGHLLVVGHAHFPPWSGHDDHPHAEPLLRAAEQVADLALDPAAWTTVVAEDRTRSVVAPDGRPAELDDAVVLLRRR